MFETRLRLLLIVAGVATLVIVVRLFELQVVRANYFSAQAERSMLLRPRPLPFIRGSIRDRTGETLVSDEACWDITIGFSVIEADVRARAGEAAISMRRLRRWQRDGYLPAADSDDQLRAAFYERLGQMWMDLALFSLDVEPETVSELRDRAKSIHDRIKTIRRLVAEHREFDSPVAEETQAHPVLSGLDSSMQVTAREQFAAYPWLQVEPSSTRRFAEGTEPFAHVLGRVGSVSAETLNNDPNAEDPFASYKPNDLHGITGVERAAEQRLRGRRGQIALDRNRQHVLDLYVEPQNGEDVYLTIHASLQRRLYRMLGEAVRDIPESSGGAIVVIHVPTREVVSVVSYPSYDPNLFDEIYPRLRDDTERLPLWFRAISSGYAPGSTIKPLVAGAGLMNGVITTGTEFHCDGYLFDEVRDAWRCWRVSGTDRRRAHGSVDVTDALKGSCNIYMYKLGEALGVDRLCSAFDMVGVGKPSGIGLTGEFDGINPTPAWLMDARSTGVTPGTARLFAMGQGELLMTPVQVANLMATYASGAYQQVSVLARDESGPRWELPITTEHWRAIRMGMYGVVNDTDGTAYRTAHFEDENYVICGKTGSATAPRRAVRYRIPWEDDVGRKSVDIVPSGSLREAIDRFGYSHPDAIFDPGQIEVAQRWPHKPEPNGEDYSHAWFGGFLQRKRPDGSPDWSRPSQMAFAVLVEYGGSGGHTSGPLARQVAGTLLDVFGPDLDPDQVNEERPDNHLNDGADLLRSPAGGGP